MADIPSDVLALSDSEDDQSHSSRGDKVTKKRSTTRKSVTRKPTSGRKRKGGESLSNQDKVLFLPMLVTCQNPGIRVYY